MKKKFEDLEGVLSSIIIENEYKIYKSNNDVEYADYEALLDMVECIRSEKNYSWMSDIFLPMFPSHLLTDASTWASQYFQSRDFVDVYLEGDEPEDKDKCQAVKSILNKTLNMKSVYHFQKYMRARIINWLFGQVYIMCYWEQKIDKRVVSQLPVVNPIMTMGADGKPFMQAQQIPQPDKEVENVIYDRFNYEVLDPRNVYTDNKYCYSIQQKDAVIIRTEKSFDQLKADEKKFNYFNLDKIKELRNDSSETETSLETYNATDGKTKSQKTPVQYLDILDRYGTMYVIPKYNDSGDIESVTPGYDTLGNVLDTAELIECVITYAGKGGNYTLIGFEPSKYIDSSGEYYKNLVRGWCYIHPSKDTGLGDGKNLREIQSAVNDTFNISNDRVMLATLPTFKGRKQSLEDNPTVYMEPEHIIELEDVKDLEELKIRDNVQAALQQIGMLKSEASEVDSIWPTTMGGLPDKTSTTATAIAGAETRTNVRGNFKSLTFEYTFLVEFYHLILQMTHRFAKPETLVKLCGEKLASVFDPAADYTYVPLTQNIEAEASKLKKVQNWDQMIGRLSGLAKIAPQEVIPLISMAVGEIAKLLGKDFRDISDKLSNLSAAKPQPEGGGAEQTADGQLPPMSNQSGVEQSIPEQGARESQNTPKMMATGGVLENGETGITGEFSNQPEMVQNIDGKTVVTPLTPQGQNDPKLIDQLLSDVRNKVLQDNPEMFAEGTISDVNPSVVKKPHWNDANNTPITKEQEAKLEAARDKNLIYKIRPSEAQAETEQSIFSDPVFKDPAFIKFYNKNNSLSVKTRVEMWKAGLADEQLQKGK